MDACNLTYKMVKLQAPHPLFVGVRKIYSILSEEGVTSTKVSLLHLYFYGPL